MAYKNKEDQAEYLKRWRNENRAKVNEDAARRKKDTIVRNREYIWNIKANTPCTDCGDFFHPVCMDFDHIEDKYQEISRLLRSASIETIQKEINKCELVCSNCHRLRTHKRQAPIV